MATIEDVTEDLIIIGVDPGVYGALARVDVAGNFRGIDDMPVVERRVRRKNKTVTRRSCDFERVWELLGEIVTGAGDGTRWVACLEQQQARAYNDPSRPREQARSGSLANFDRGYSYGVFQSLFLALGMHTILVSPQRWQKLAIPGSWTRDERKKQSVRRAEELWPDADVFRGPRGGARDGRSDAALIAWFGMQQVTGASLCTVTIDEDDDADFHDEPDRDPSCAAAPVAERPDERHLHRVEHPAPGDVADAAIVGPGPVAAPPTRGIPVFDSE